VPGEEPYHVRPGLERDAEALTRVQAASWRTTYSNIVDEAVFDQMDRRLDSRIAQWAERLAQPGVKIWVAASPQDRLVGFIDGGPLRESVLDYDQELYAIYLLKGWQGRGIGKALVGELARGLHEAGGRRLMVWVLTDNLSARHFYARLGAKEVMEQAVQIGSQQLQECAYGWESLSLLV
jgi:GNAT superfamily N-acetyltransferase